MKAPLNGSMFKQYYTKPLRRWLVFLPLLSTITGFSVYAAPLTEPVETSLWKVQFAVLHATNATALETEVWSSAADDRAAALTDLNSLKTELNNTNTQAQAQQPQELLQLLAPLTQNRRFKVLMATQWTQPSTLKKKELPLFFNVNDFDAFDTVFGSISLEERNSLVAQVALTVVDQDTLDLVEIDLALDPFKEEQTSLQPIDAKQALTLPPEQASLEPSMTLGTKPTQNTTQAMPILFLNQQRQIKLNQIHYFDHPVTPGFLLVSRNQTSP